MLRITRQTDYGIVLMTLFIEGRDAGGKEAGGKDAGGNGTAASVMSARDMATETKLPLPTVSKILKALTRANVLTSTRGVKGGYSLSRDAGEITIAQIIEALEGPISITDCAQVDVSRDCLIKDSCPCESNWTRINNAVRGALDAVRLADMASGCRIVFADPVEGDVAEKSGATGEVEQEQDPTA